LTVDEELNRLDDCLRRLKIEYDVFFGGGKKTPPNDLEWEVQKYIKKYSDSQKLSFAQRFRYNTIAQRYAIQNSVWQQKLRVREEGYRRPADAVLSIQGLRTEQEHQAAAEMKHSAAAHAATSPASSGQVFAIECTGADAEQDKVKVLFDAMLEAKRRAGEQVPPAKFESFQAFIKLKTDQIRRDYKCEAVEYRIEMLDNRVTLKAKAKA
jgi:hypothetical protein